MRSWVKYVPLYLAAVAMGGAYGAGLFDGLGGQAAQAAAAGERIQFSSCHVGGGYNCVVDGDTIWLNGQKIRIADIDTPETLRFRLPIGETARRSRHEASPAAAEQRRR